MEFEVACPQCGLIMRANDQLLGKEVACPACKAHFLVPGQEKPASSSASTAAPDHRCAKCGARITATRLHDSQGNPLCKACYVSGKAPTSARYVSCSMCGIRVPAHETRFADGHVACKTCHGKLRPKPDTAWDTEDTKASVAIPSPEAGASLELDAESPALSGRRRNPGSEAETDPGGADTESTGFAIITPQPGTGSENAITDATSVPTFPAAASPGHGVIERYRPGKYSHGDPDTGTCPHCWTVFPLEDALFIAKHPDLLGDPLLGPEAPQRFKASRFTPEGLAIDVGGMPTNEMACPACHLDFPRSLVDLKPIFFSIVGAPASGKTYYLGCLTWELRRCLTQDFGFSITDADSSMNRQLHEYEETLFFPAEPGSFVSLRKTELQGELYNQVNFGGQVTRFPRPFIFNLKPLAHNPACKRGGRSIVLYDNAGEHFQPGMDNSLAPTTHLARAKYLLFIFDPTKDPRFRSAVRSNDPQVQPGARLQRQDVILNEAATRIRRYLGIRQDEKVRKRLVVIVSKMDVWSDLLKIPLRKPPHKHSSKYPVSGLDMGHIETVSFCLREMLEKISPEVVTVAEDFSTEVVYIPVSALGCSPALTAQGVLGVRPRDIRPVWVHIPFLYALALEGLILTSDHKRRDAEHARLVREVGGIITCSLSDGTLVSVPERCSGKCLQHPSTGRPFRVPGEGSG